MAGSRLREYTGQHPSGGAGTLTGEKPALWPLPSGQGVLDDVQVLPDVSVAVADCSLVIGTTARQVAGGVPASPSRPREKWPRPWSGEKR